MASSSPFFWELLKKNRHPRPLIYMRGVKFEDLLAIADFLYLGEAKVFQDNLDTFLALAGELNLKGLTSDDRPKEMVESPQKQRKVKKNPVYQTFPKLEDDIEPQFETRVALADKTVVNVELDQLDEQISTMVDLTEKFDHLKRKLAKCNICGHEAPRSYVVRHIEANHITGVTHPCEICGKTARSRHAMRKHMYSWHKNMFINFRSRPALSAHKSREHLKI